jgi:aspartyl/glutamyl-tRNA(Asn/Gln) amidotransferase C subunit
MSTTITRDDLLHLLKLSKLEISADQEPFYLHSLNKLMDTLNQLQHVVVDENEQVAYPLANLKQRDGQAIICTNRTVCEQQAPNNISHFFIVPQVIE